MRVLVLNGPNLNLLGTREPEVYGRESLADVEDTVRKAARGLKVQVDFYQTNSEGDLVEQVQACRGAYDGIVLNPGGLTHYSVALLDALLAVKVPAVEVHLTNLARREEFRHTSIVARGVIGRVEGFGAEGYCLGLRGLVTLLRASGR